MTRRTPGVAQQLLAPPRARARGRAAASAARAGPSPRAGGGRCDDRAGAASPAPGPARGSRASRRCRSRPGSSPRSSTQRARGSAGTPRARPPAILSGTARARSWPCEPLAVRVLGGERRAARSTTSACAPRSSSTSRRSSIACRPQAVEPVAPRTPAARAAATSASGGPRNRPIASRSAPLPPPASPLPRARRRRHERLEALEVELARLRAIASRPAGDDRLRGPSTAAAARRAPAAPCDADRWQLVAQIASISRSAVTTPSPSASSSAASSARCLGALSSIGPCAPTARAVRGSRTPSSYRRLTKPLPGSRTIPACPASSAHAVPLVLPRRPADRLSCPTAGRSSMPWRRM